MWFWQSTPFKTAGNDMEWIWKKIQTIDIKDKMSESCLKLHLGQDFI